MRNFLLGSSLLALSLPGAAQQPGWLVPAVPSSSANESGTGEASPRLSASRPELASRIPRQERDYSRRALFLEYHGAYLQKSRRYQPAIAASWLSMPDATIKHEPGSFDLDRLRFDMTLPLAVDPDHLIYVGGRYAMHRYDFSRTVTGAQDDKFYEAGVNLGFGSFLSENVFLEARFTPGIYSDWDDTLHGKDYKFYGNALLTGRVHEDVFLKVGFAYNGTFDEVPVYPRLGVAWALSPEFRFDMVLPEYVEFSWLPNSGFILSLGTECYGDEFRSRSSLATNRVSRKQQTQQIDLYLRGVIRFDDHFSLFGKVGTTYAGDNDFRDNTTARYNGTLDWNPFFQVGFGIDF